MKMVDESSINDFELETEGIKIKLSKGQAPNFISAPQQASYYTPQIPTMPQNTSPAILSGAIRDEEEIEAGLYEIKSPIVGTFYRSPSPESPVFVEIGSSITAGKTLCIIEAMKLMNEIESDVDGTIVKVLVENGKPVEYGQPLFLIKLD